MGYFSNGTEGEDYQQKWCSRCLHENVEKYIGCPVWNLHLLHNYDECNKPDSYLHRLIPRDGTENKRCSMFVDRGLLSNLALEKFESDKLHAL
jgi:hypothetical protein